MYRTTDISIEPGVYSDHSIISIKITANTNTKETRGRGLWKLNTSLLKDKDYIARINKTLEESEIKYSTVTDARLLWDTIKMDIRSKTISYASYKKKVNNQVEKELLDRLTNLEALIADEPNDDNIQEYVTTKNEIELVNNERTKGCQIRARCMHIDANEYNSKYFLNKEISNAEQKACQALELDNGEVITDSKRILEEQTKFYKNLYTDKEKDLNNKETDEATNYFIDEKDIDKQLNDIEKQETDRQITLEEVTNAVKELANGKSPGLDGLPIEFYKIFWSKIQHKVFNSLTRGLEEKKLSIPKESNPNPNP
jgi:hypothetical protein